MDDWRLKIGNKGIIPVLIPLHTNLIASNPQLITPCFCATTLYCVQKKKMKASGILHCELIQVNAQNRWSQCYFLHFSPKKDSTRFPENRLMKQTCEAVRCAIFVLPFSPTYLKQALRADKLPPEQLATRLNAHWESIVKDGLVSESGLSLGSVQRQWGWVWFT